MGFHEIPKVEDMVKDELIENPKTRESDELLTVYIYHDYFGIRNESFVDIMLRRKELGIPSMETIGRCRRKLQEKYPLIYGSSGYTTRLRRESEIEFYEYALE